MLRNRGARLLWLGYCTAVFLLFGSSTVVAVLIGIGAGWYYRNPPNLWRGRRRPTPFHDRPYAIPILRLRL
jgi:hypothetical protein